MTARHKLNAATLNGVLVTALVVGYLTESIVIGCIVAAVLLFGAYHQGHFRP